MKKEVDDIPRLLTTADVVRITGYSRRTVIRWAETGEHGFPQPCIQGRPGVGSRWHPDDIKEWLRSLRTL